MGRSKDLATGETRFANVSGDTFTGNVGIGGAPNKEFHVRDDNSFGNGSRIVAALSPSITNGQDAGLAFGTYSPDDYWKQGIFWERTGSYGLGHLHFANRGTADSTTVSKADAKMTINANGSVTMPSQPAFFARHTTAAAYTSAYITNWSSVTYNVGNHFNGSTGVFTSPVAGVYQLNAMIGNNYANGIGNYDVRVNNTQVAGLIFDPFAGQNTWATNVLVGQVKVSANDTVRIYVNGAGYPDNASWTSWSMCLIS